MVVYTDFQCPFCRRFAQEIWPALREAYVRPQKVLFVLRHLPIVQLHPDAAGAAAGAVCAGLQGRFWDMHDRLFERPKAVDEANLMGHAQALSLDSNSFRRCLATEGPAAVQRDIAEAREFGITGTPSFFFGSAERGEIRVRRRLSGAKPIAEFKAILDELLAGSQDSSGKKS
jgi:protein-disulfide isomerase